MQSSSSLFEEACLDDLGVLDSLELEACLLLAPAAGEGLETLLQSCQTSVSGLQNLEPAASQLEHFPLVGSF